MPRLTSKERKDRKRKAESDRKRSIERLRIHHERETKIAARQKESRALLSDAEGRYVQSTCERQESVPCSVKHQTLVEKEKRARLDFVKCSKQFQGAELLTSSARLPRNRKKVSEKHIAKHSNVIRAFQRGSRRRKGQEGAMDENRMNSHFDSVMDENEVDQGMDILVLSDFDNPKNEGDLFEIIDNVDDYVSSGKNRKQKIRRVNGSRGGKCVVLSELNESEKKEGLVIYQFASDLQKMDFNPGTSYYLRIVYCFIEFCAHPMCIIQLSVING